MRKTEQFRQQHDAIVATVTELSAYLSRPKLDENIPTVVALLVRLSGKIKAHLAMEDGALYPRMISSADPQAAELAKQYQAEMGDISEAFKNYVAQWLSPAAIGDDPNAFIKETKALFAALSDRIDRENQILYRLADQL